MRRNIGLAEADAIRAKGEAEAEARRLLAEALKLYNEAGLSIEALKVLPEIAAAISEPLSRAGTTTIISNGNGHEGTGAAKLSQDVVQVLSQLSPIMEQLAGVDLKRFLQDVSKIPAAVTGADRPRRPAAARSSPPELRDEASAMTPPATTLPELVQQLGRPSPPRAAEDPRPRLVAAAHHDARPAAGRGRPARAGSTPTTSWKPSPRAAAARPPRRCWR